MPLWPTHLNESLLMKRLLLPLSNQLLLFDELLEEQTGSQQVFQLLMKLFNSSSGGIQTVFPVRFDCKRRICCLEWNWSACRLFGMTGWPTPLLRAFKTARRRADGWPRRNGPVGAQGRPSQGATPIFLCPPPSQVTTQQR